MHGFASAFLVFLFLLLCALAGFKVKKVHIWGGNGIGGV